MPALRLSLKRSLKRPLRMAEKLARTIAKLGDALAAGDHYGALQMYRTAIQRKYDGGHNAEATNLLLLGARTLAAAGKYRECFDLGDMFLKIAASEHGEKRPPLPLSVFAASAVCVLVDSVVAGPSDSTKRKNQLVTNDHVALAARAAFAKRALRWAAANAKTNTKAAAEESDETAARLQPDAAPKQASQAKKLLALVYLTAARAFRDAALASLHSFMRNVLEARSSSSSSSSSTTASATPAKLEVVSSFIHDAESSYLHAGDAPASGSVLKSADISLPESSSSTTSSGDEEEDLALKEWRRISEKLSASSSPATSATAAGAFGGGKGHTLALPPMLDFSTFMALLAMHAYRSETEIFACKPVLHLAAMGSLRDANRYREGWICAAQLLSSSSSSSSAGVGPTDEALEWPAAPTSATEPNATLVSWAKAGLQELAKTFDLPLPPWLSSSSGALITPLLAKEALESPLCHFVSFTLQTCEVSSCELVASRCCIYF